MTSPWTIVAITDAADPTGRIKRVAAATGWLQAAAQLLDGEAGIVVPERIDLSAWRVIDGELVPSQEVMP